MAAPRTRRAPAAKPRTLAEVAKDGNRLASLVALRDLLAAQLTGAERDHAALARQFRDVLAEIDTLHIPVEESKVDDLAKRRENRRAEAAGQ